MIPGVRGLRRDALGARFARLLGVLLDGGAPLLSALDDAAASIGDPLAHEETLRIRARVREGMALHRAIDGGGFFPPLLGQMAAVGEEAGELDVFLLNAAGILEVRVARMHERAVSLVEPAMIPIFGAIVAFVALSLLQAIYGVNADAFR